MTTPPTPATGSLPPFAVVTLSALSPADGLVHSTTWVIPSCHDHAGQMHAHLRSLLGEPAAEQVNPPAAVAAIGQMVVDRGDSVIVMGERYSPPPGAQQ